MRTPRSDGIQTRKRLLETSCRIFAEKGYWKTTLAEVCRQAEANVAAVNYHFGSKEALYVEAWKFAFEMSVKTHPPAGGVPPEAPPEERFRGRILSLMRRVGDKNNRAFDILGQEMANPTGLLKGTINESIEPIRKGLSSIIGEILGEKASDEDVRFCQMSVTAQIFGPLFRERRKSRKGYSRNPLPDIEKWAKHIINFSLAGIKDVRERLQKN